MSDDALTMRGPVHGTKDARKVAIGSGVGAVIETYDFIGFGTAAALYFGHAFFPGASPLAGTLASFATLGVGFAARPLGGIIGGHLGDKLGRKPVLVASLIVMGLATFVIGLLPTYAAVGILAPILLVTVRIIQGIAFGAVLAVVYVALSCVLFVGVFRFAIRRGLIARYSAETVS